MCVGERLSLFNNKVQKGGTVVWTTSFTCLLFSRFVCSEGEDLWVRSGPSHSSSLQTAFPISQSWCSVGRPRCYPVTTPNTEPGVWSFVWSSQVCEMKYLVCLSDRIHPFFPLMFSRQLSLSPRNSMKWKGKDGLKNVISRHYKVTYCTLTTYLSLY